ncbi:MAG: hypothetical protein E7091_03820 [Bacteroidales bacterium]|nr:hypothetical protein [Bacteroidales bacterium]
MIQYETTHNHRSIDTADHRSGGTGCSTAFVGMGNRWTFEEGDFHVAVGRESLRIRSTEGRVY